MGTYVMHHPCLIFESFIEKIGKPLIQERVEILLRLCVTLEKIQPDPEVFTHISQLRIYIHKIK